MLCSVQLLNPNGPKTRHISGVQGSLTTVNTLGPPDMFAVGGVFAITSSENTGGQTIGALRVVHSWVLFTMAGFIVARNPCTPDFDSQKPNLTIGAARTHDRHGRERLAQAAIGHSPSVPGTRLPRCKGCRTRPFMLCMHARSKCSALKAPLLDIQPAKVLRRSRASTQLQRDPLRTQKQSRNERSGFKERW